MVTGLIIKYAAIAVGLILFGLFVKRSSEVGLGIASQEVGKSVGSFGSGLGELGGGVKEFGEGVGTGISKLFNPLFTLRDLIYPPQAGNQPAPTATTQGQIPAVNPPATIAAPQVPPVVIIPQPLPVTVFQNLGSNLSVNAVYQPVGFGAGVVGVRGKPLPKYAISRTQITYGGIISTQAGGTRKIQGSAALFNRLASNLAASSLRVP